MWRGLSSAGRSGGGCPSKSRRCAPAHALTPIKCLPTPPFPHVYTRSSPRNLPAPIATASTIPSPPLPAHRHAINPPSPPAHRHHPPPLPRLIASPPAHHHAIAPRPYPRHISSLSPRNHSSRPNAIILPARSSPRHHLTLYPRSSPSNHSKPRDVITSPPPLATQSLHPPRGLSPRHHHKLLARSSLRHHPKPNATSSSYPFPMQSTQPTRSSPRYHPFPPAHRHAITSNLTLYARSSPCHHLTPIAKQHHPTTLAHSSPGHTRRVLARASAQRTASGPSRVPPVDRCQSSAGHRVTCGRPTASTSRTGRAKDRLARARKRRSGVVTASAGRFSITAGGGRRPCQRDHRTSASWNSS